MQQIPNPFRSVAVLSGKGGTGKSIITASLGYILAKCGFKTLLVDADLFTGGLTFYSLAEHPRHLPIALQNLFLSDSSLDAAHFRSISIPNKFAEGKLFLLPALASKTPHRSELLINTQFQSIERFSSTLRDIIRSVAVKEEVEYVIVDTRGGTDLTSVGTTLVVDGFIVVTEADKTSWDVGEVLFDAVREASHSDGPSAEAFGFIINKNVLPTESIVAFLRQRWQCPHLATVPLDENAIRYYQQDKVPVVEDIECPFSSALVPVVRRLFVNESWKSENLAVLVELEKAAHLGEIRRSSNVRKVNRTERASITLKIYGTALSVILLLGVAIQTMVASSNESTHGFNVFVPIFVSILIFTMTGSDPKMIERIINIANFLKLTRKRTFKQSSKSTKKRSK
jgi:cellulose biosynthesis protein BcsQ